MSFLNDLFRTKYRVLHKEDRFVVQEHCWFDLIYGWWWTVDVASNIDDAVEIINRCKRVKAKKQVVYKD